jgi:tetratricopeptide (TPR) repeat protein
MKFFLAVTVLLCSYGVYSQQTPKTQEELEAFLKSVQKKSDSMQNVLKNKKTTGNPNTATNGTIKPGNSKKDNDPENLKLPKKDTAALRRIPSKNFSPAEISIYITGIRTQLIKLLSADVVRSANAIAQKLQNNPLKMETTSLIAWNSGAWEEALLLITDAASRSADEIILTNAGAMLDMAGLSEISVPILRTVVRNSPNNAIAFNNLGQAYAALGQQDSALYYCGGSIKLSPQHPESNNTAGVIELIRGNKEKAQTYFENSIRGSFNIAAYKGLKSLLKDKCRIAHLIKPKVKLPEYFNQFKFKLPGQCANVQQAVIRKEEQKIFRQSLSEAIGFYQKLGKEAGQKMRQKTPEQRNAEVMNKAMKGERVFRPFQVLGGIMEAETILAYNDDFNALKHFNTENRKQYAAVEIEYKKAYDSLRKKYTRDDDEHECCGEGDVSCCNDGFCRESNTLKNKFLTRFAQLNEEWQSRNLLLEKTHLDNFLYWAYFAAIDRDDFTVRFYLHVVNYLKTLQRLDVIKILEPCHVPEDDEEEEKKDTSTVKVRDCPVAFYSFLDRQTGW